MSAFRNCFCLPSPLTYHRVQARSACKVLHPANIFWLEEPPPPYLSHNAELKELNLMHAAVSGIRVWHWAHPLRGTGCFSLLHLSLYFGSKNMTWSPSRFWVERESRVKSQASRVKTHSKDSSSRVKSRVKTLKRLKKTEKQKKLTKTLKNRQISRLRLINIEDM
jgi:hypothetical protein